MRIEIPFYLHIGELQRMLEENRMRLSHPVKEVVNPLYT